MGNKKVMRKVLISVLLILLLLITVLIVFNSSHVGNVSNKKRVCPEEWFDDQMPRVINDKVPDIREGSSQYFIIGGERKEIKDYDLDWIRDNCTIKPQIIY